MIAAGVYCGIGVLTDQDFCNDLAVMNPGAGYPEKSNQLLGVLKG
jgi:hypothetical protein